MGGIRVRFEFLAGFVVPRSILALLGLLVLRFCRHGLRCVVVWIGVEARVGLSQIKK